MVIHVKEHDFFAREDENLICQIPISFVQATLGDTLPVPLLGEEDPHELTIPKGTQPGEIIKVPGKGMTSLRGFRKRGDLYIKIVVKIPEKLNQRQKELLEEFATYGRSDPVREKEKGKEQG